MYQTLTKEQAARGKALTDAFLAIVAEPTTADSIKAEAFRTYRAAMAELGKTVKLVRI